LSNSCTSPGYSPVHRVVEPDLQPGDDRLGDGQVALGLSHVERRHDARLEAVLHQLERLLLALGVAGGGADLVLQRADLDVVDRHLGEEAHQHVAVVLDRRLHLGVGRLDRAAHPTPEVDLPGRVEPGRVDGVGAGARRSDRGRGVLRDAVADHVAGGVHLRVELARGHASPGARLLDALERELQIEVALAGPLDEPGQFRILEHLPPHVECGLAVLEALGRRLVPRVGQRRFGRRVVRSDGDAARQDQQRRQNQRRADETAGPSGTRRRCA
jgi:hypothetical protein